MLYLDLVMYLHSLSAETKIIIFQLSFLTFEILYFFWLRKYFDEQEKRNYYNTRVYRNKPKTQKK